MSKYYYGEVLLTEIPYEDYTQYPYLMILQNTNGNIYIYGSTSKPYYQVKSSVERLELPTGRTRSLYNAEDGSWGAINSSTSATFCNLSENWSIIWSNFNIPNGSETSTDIYFYTIEPYCVLYLVKADGKLYTVVDGTLSELATTDIVAQTFLDYGIDDIPDGALLVGLSNPEVLYWQDSEDNLPTLTATVTATPPPQTIISSRCDLSDATITGIENMLATCEGELICAVSFDDKATWKAHNGVEWVTVSDEYVGMSKETLEAITLEQWNELYLGASGMYIRIALTDATQILTKIEVDFSN